MTAPIPPVPLVGDGLMVPCLDGIERPYLSLDAAASTSALPSVFERVQEFVPHYSSVHRGAGYKSQLATAAYEAARQAALSFANRADRDDVAIICRNTTEAINHLAYRLRLKRDDVVLTTVVEHHANLLPWRRVATCRFIECTREGTFEIGAVEEALGETPTPRIVTITGASNITGWMPPIEAIVSAAHFRGIPVVLDAAQLAPHRPIPHDVDFVAFSGHKMYAPFGAGILIGPRATFADGDPFLVGGGAVDLVDLDEVTWTTPPDREEAGSPNVIGAVALHGAVEVLCDIGWPALISHDRRIARQLRTGLHAIKGIDVLGPSDETDTLPVVTFVVKGVPHALVAARLSMETAIGVRHGCFCTHPYLVRLLGLSQADVARYREEVRRGDHRSAPGAIRASAGINTTDDDVARLLDAVALLASGQSSPVEYQQDPRSGDYTPITGLADWQETLRRHGSSCSSG